MKSPELTRLLYPCLKSRILAGVFWVIAGSFAHSQDSPTPPTPHRGPVLPGTHVPPKLISPRLGIVLHIEGPATINQKKCGADAFEIKYSLTNNTTEPANGTIRASFDGAWLTPIGSAKINNLLPGKAVTGMFTACCPSSGSFNARVEYGEESSTVHSKVTATPQHSADSLDIRCT